MTRAMVVFESMFGNTEAVARAIADGLSTGMQVQAVPVSEAPNAIDGDVALLLAGGPTHAFGMSRASTRGDAVKQGGQPTGGLDVGLREWLSRLRRGSSDVAAVAFDTRIKKRGVPGSAARGARRATTPAGIPDCGPGTLLLCWRHAGTVAGR
ncbi:MAG: flavodoxin domain-containing protein [Frankiaceae bacterium]